jgi:glycogen synthase kinase 3 beta
MTYYDCDLHYYIKQHEKKRLPNFDIKIISYQIFRALFYIHSKGICHRDIKPHNILLKGKNAVICDFGSAKILSLG